MFELWPPLNGATHFTIQNAITIDTVVVIIIIQFSWRSRLCYAKVLLNINGRSQMQYNVGRKHFQSASWKIHADAIVCAFVKRNNFAADTLIDFLIFFIVIVSCCRCRSSVPPMKWQWQTHKYNSKIETSEDCEHFQIA